MTCGAPTPPERSAVSLSKRIGLFSQAVATLFKDAILDYKMKDTLIRDLILEQDEP